MVTTTSIYYIHFCQCHFFFSYFLFGTKTLGMLPSHAVCLNVSGISGELCMYLFIYFVIRHSKRKEKTAENERERDIMTEWSDLINWLIWLIGNSQQSEPWPAHL